LVNCIIGNSDAGKSAILRAIRWVLFNRPSGESFRSWWGGTTKATIFTNDQKITRIRGKQNGYFLNGKLLEAVRSDVPDEVSKALNMSEINIQRQHDKVFLFSDSPGEVARHFNEIAHIDDIDYATKNIQSWIRKTNQEIEVTNNQITNYTEDLKKYSNLESLEYQVSELEKLDQRKQEIETKVKVITNLITRSSVLDSLIERVQNKLKHKDVVNTCLGLYKALETTTEQKNGIIKAVKQLKSINIKQKELQRLTKLSDIVEEALSLYRNLFDIYKKRNQIKDKSDELELINIKITKTKKEYEVLLEKYETEFPLKCPLCGKKK
jgi:exonuclease SbcC